MRGLGLGELDDSTIKSRPRLSDIHDKEGGCTVCTRRTGRFWRKAFRRHYEFYYPSLHA